MDFGLVLQTDPPASRVVELMKRAEDNGFTHGWTFDSAVLWQEPFVLYGSVLERTSRLVVGPMVTNPATRAAWTRLNPYAVHPPCECPTKRIGMLASSGWRLSAPSCESPWIKV